MSSSGEANAPPEIVHCSVNGNENYYVASLKYQTEDPAEEEIFVKVEPDPAFAECSVIGAGAQIIVDDNFSYGNIPIYVCDRCNKIFERKNRLKAHMRLHFPRWHKCRYCGKRFWKRSNLVYHERIHLGERPYSCSSCYKTFIHKSDLIEHEETHVSRLALRNQNVGSNHSARAAVTKAPAKEVYECDFCKISFHHKRNLLTHMETHQAFKFKVYDESLVRQAEGFIRKQIQTYKYVTEQIHEASSTFANSIVKQENTYLDGIYERKCDTHLMNVKTDPLIEIHKTEVVDVDVLPPDEEINIKYEYVPEEEEVSKLVANEV